jgi:hypothetical protein
VHLHGFANRLLTVRVGAAPYYQDSLDSGFVDALQAALRDSTS